MNQESDLKELLLKTVPALQERYGSKHPLTLRGTRDLVFLLEEQGMDAEEWRQHLPDIEEEADVDMDESLEDCEDPEVAELVRDFLGKQHPLSNNQVCRVLSSSASGSTPAAAQDAASSAPALSIPPSQGLQVLSEAGSSQCGYMSYATSSDSSTWLKAALQQKLLEREERGK